MKKNYLITSEKKGRVVPLFNPTFFLSAFLFFLVAEILRAENDPEYDEEVKAMMAPQADCDVFSESNGLVVIQAESKIANGWIKKSENGASYIQWNGSESFNNTSNGRITYKVKFNSPGIYRFVWKNTIKKGSDRAEHNDSWLKFPNNSSMTFFGHRGDLRNVEADLKAKRNVVFPGGTGMSPTPNGSSLGGYFKVYINSTSWGWVASTSDHEPHRIYVQVKQAGTYDMQIAGRSTGHAIDGIVMYHLGKQGSSLSSSKLNSLLSSVKDCSDIPDDPDPTPTNAKPNISSISDKSVVEGKSLTVKVSASDPDNDAINLSVVIKKGSSNYSTNKYKFTSSNGGKAGELVISPTSGDAGKLDVTIKASDGKATDEEQFSVQVSKPDDPDPAPGGENITVYLVNTSNNQDIKSLGNNSSFAVGNVGMRAEIKGIKVPGVTFRLKGGPDNISHVQTEGSQPPYSAFGDIGDKVNPWKNIKAGKYSLEVVVWNQASKTINFTVTSGSNPNPDPDPTPGDDGIMVTKFYLINPSNNSRIRELKNGDNISSGSSVNVEAVTDPGKVGSVIFKLNGKNYRTENVAPYALGGDGNGNFYSISLKQGSNTIEAIPYEKQYGNGSAGKPLKISVTVGSSSSARLDQPLAKSKTDELSPEDQLYTDFKIARLYPNPVAEELTLEYTGKSEKEDVALTLVSRLGQSFEISKDDLIVNGSTIKVNMSQLNISAGVYILKVANLNTGTTEVYRLIKY